MPRITRFMFEPELVQAAASGNLDEVKKLIRVGKIDLPTGLVAYPRCDTALICAVKNGHVDVARFLINAYEDAIKKIKLPDTNAITSAFNRAVDFVRNLIVTDPVFIYINHKDIDGKNVLCYALEQNNLEMAKLFIQKGANVDAVNDVNGVIDGQSLLIQAAIKDKSAVIDLLLEHKADIDAKDQYGRTALMWAVIMGSVGALKSLLRSKIIKINEQDNDGNSAFNYATRHMISTISPRIVVGTPTLTEIAELLLRRGANVIKPGRSTLSRHARDLVLERRLLLAAADGNVEEIDTVLAKASTYMEQTYISMFVPSEFLSPFEYPWLAPFLAAKNGHLAAIEKLLIFDEHNCGLCAAANGHTNILQILLGRSVPFTSNFIDVRNRYSTLTYAVANGHVDTVRFILANAHKFSNPLLRIKTKLMDLKVATENKHYEICILLTKHIKKTASALYRDESHHRYYDSIKFTLDYAWTKPDKTDFEELMVMLFPNAKADLKKLPNDVQVGFVPYFKGAAGLLFQEYKNAHYKMITNFPMQISNGILPLGTIAFAFSNARTFKHANGTEEVISPLPGVIQSKILAFAAGGIGKGAEVDAIEKIKKSTLNNKII